MKSITKAIPKETNRYVAIAGFALVVIGGIGMTPAIMPNWILPALGAFLGLFSVKDTKGFLLAGLALIAVKWGLQFLPVIGDYTEPMANQLVAFIAPAMLIVSVRSIYDQLKS